MKIPTHDEIAQQAHHLWQDRGCPANCDTALWLEAEQQLSESRTPDSEVRADAFVTYARGFNRPENPISYQVPAAATEREANQADQQKEDARAPLVPRHTGPKGKPSESGKPIWAKSHSS
ncbi:DUF2934 domain-containing protein [Oleiharenicola lentus]|nr:DUF2934 domain-containing protein [Oleiharenicola lentus]